MSVIGAQLAPGRAAPASPRMRAGPERLTGWISSLAVIFPCDPAIAASKAHGRSAGYMIRQMIGQRTACQLLAGEGASRVLDAEIM